MKVLSKAEAVEMYGSDKCKEHFGKYGKLKSKTIEDSLIKTLEQHFESVEKIKVGRSIQYQVGDALTEVIEREDGRASNGLWSIDYTKNMDVLVVSVLEVGKIPSNAQTIKKWLLDFGLVEKTLFDLMGFKNNPDEKAKQRYINNLVGGDIVKYSEKKVLDDYADMAKELMGQLERTLSRMKKANIIDFYEVPKAKLLQTEEEKMNGDEPKTINLHESTVDKINGIKRGLMDDYNLNAYEWAHLTNRPDVKEAKKIFDDHLATSIYDENGNHLPINFWWKAHAISLKATKKRTMTYLKKYNAEALDAYNKDKIKFIDLNKTQYVDGRRKRVMQMAENKQSKFVMDDRPSIMGKRKPSFVDHPFDTGYYELFLNNQYVEKIEQLERYYGLKL